MELLKTTGVGIWVWFWVVVLMMGTGGVMLWTKPWVVEQQTKIIRNSNAYVTSKQSALRTLKADYDALNVRLAEIGGDNPELTAALQAQRAGIIRQMQQEADTIPHDVPGDIRPLISR